MKISFAGGVDEVGSLGMVAESGDTRILFDYGMTPTKPPKYPMKTPLIDSVFITHSHLDHVGMTPWLCGEFGTSVWGTEVTLEVATILLQDSIKIAKYEGWALPYNISDLRRFTEESTILRYNDRMFKGPITIRAMDAGHIPGSTMYRFDDGGRELVFTGDINTVDTRLLKGIQPPKCDVLIMESTYAGREHPPRKEVERQFLAKVEEVLDRGGKVIVPAFAVGRTQEVVQVLDKIKEEKWLDGMGRRVAQIYLRHPEFLKSSGSMRKALDQFTFVRTPHQRRKASESPIIVTTSGMLDGGPVLQYLNEIRKDKKSAILLTGYQVEGTNGRMLMDSGSIDMNGDIVKIDCEVCHFDFSAHAGHDELIRFAEGSGADDVVLMHGDQREELVKDLGSVGKVHTPVVGEYLDF